MKDSYEQRIQNQFGAFCVKVLKNEARHIQREYARLRDQEKSLGELTAFELEQTAVHRPSDRIEAAARYTERIARVSGEGGI